MNSKIAKRYIEDGMAVTPKPQLVVGLYVRLLEDLDKAAEAIDSGDIEGAHIALIHAQDIVLELNLALDLDVWDGARSLRAIYDHIGAKLMEANVDKDATLVKHCIALVGPLRDAWREASLVEQADRAGALGPRSPTGSTGAAS